MVSKFYAVRVGRARGIFSTWEECKKNVHGYPGAQYKSFKTKSEADEYIQQKPPLPPLHFENDLHLNNTTSLPTKRKSSPNLTSTSTPPSTSKHLKLHSASQFEDEDDEEGTEIRYLIEEIENDQIEERRSHPQPLPLPLPLPLPTKSNNTHHHNNNEEVTKVYTDGCCFGNGSTGPRKAGVGVYFGEGDERNVSLPLPKFEKNGVLRSPSNQQAEIYAAIKAVEVYREAGGTAPLMILSDSHYLINAMTSYIHGWLKLKPHQRAKNVTNWDLFEDLHHQLLKCEFEVHWRYVKAHCGILGNERADEYAKEGAYLY